MSAERDTEGGTSKATATRLPDDPMETEAPLLGLLLLAKRRTADARTQFANTWAAYEGMEIALISTLAERRQGCDRSQSVRKRDVKYAHNG